VLSGPAILRISVLLIIAGLLAAVVQFLLPSPAPEPASRPASPAASSSKAEPPAEDQPAEPPSPPAASAEPVREPPAPPRAAAVPAAPAQMPSDALAVPSDPAAPPEAQAQVPDSAGQAEIDRAEDTAGPRAVAVVDLNTASVADLNRLRGGGAIGRAIVAKRPYTSVDQLLSKRVLSRSVYERIRDQVTVR
jgi:DNA uptake protein ComE-like DNA-binding protein